MRDIGSSVADAVCAFRLVQEMCRDAEMLIDPSMFVRTESESIDEGRVPKLLSAFGGRGCCEDRDFKTALTQCDATNRR